IPLISSFSATLPPDSYRESYTHIPLISSFSATLPPDSYRESYTRLWHDRQQGISAVYRCRNVILKNQDYLMISVT
ncbi:MAG TPA: hypothetical protein P5565_10035, partial [Bacteroidia bacterium]|nr:hypothetical protein [Bacteroidia bacterium]